MLFVCTGNTCRSPMAEALFRQAASQYLACGESQLRENGVDVFSAGVAAASHYPASPEAVAVLKEQGVDLSQHLSQQVAGHMLDQSTWILTLTDRHRRILLDARPDLADRIQLLDPAGQDISDPIGGSIEEYRECAAQIRDRVDYWAQRLLNPSAQ
ncbi:MAG: low molecular weight protein arginine phosphatase [Planctomycetaceae bacterium]|nr:low molecular weight protein arginine phosphatase [Planctomycetaceae bacterium]